SVFSAAIFALTASTSRSMRYSDATLYQIMVVARERERLRDGLGARRVVAILDRLLRPARRRRCVPRGARPTRQGRQHIAVCDLARAERPRPAEARSSRRGGSRGGEVAERHGRAAACAAPPDQGHTRRRRTVSSLEGCRITG